MPSIRSEEPVLATRKKTRQIMVGDVAVGGDAPISVQSMTTTKTTDINATLQQIAELTAACRWFVRWRELCRVGEAPATDASAFALGEDALHLGFDFFGRLFIWEPAPTTGQTIVFIHAVGAADDNAGIAIEVIDLAVNGEQDIRISRLHPYLATVIFSDLITELFGRAHLVIAV